MRLSTDRILTTHVGSLPRPQNLLDLLYAKDRGGLADRVAFDDVVEAITVAPTYSYGRTIWANHRSYR